MTNRQWLASLNNKELAKWLSDPQGGTKMPCMMCDYWNANPGCWQVEEGMECDNAWERWLQSEHKNENT